MRKRAPNNIALADRSEKYRYVEKDPDMEFVASRILESGRSPEWIETETEKNGHKVSSAAIIGWLYGKTRRPQNYTMSNVMMVLGYRKEWVGRTIPRDESAIWKPRKEVIVKAPEPVVEAPKKATRKKAVSA
jgi:hypothetical protein